jgi:hypothetical protein
MTSQEEFNNDRKTIISTLWIFVLINMIYADIIGMLRPGYLEILDRYSKELDKSTVLIFSALMEVPIAMIILSRLLPLKYNRIAHLVAIPVSMIYVVFGGLTDPPYSYIFFATIEILTMLVIGWLVWRSPKGEVHRLN